MASLLHAAGGAIQTAISAADVPGADQPGTSPLISVKISPVWQLVSSLICVAAVHFCCLREVQRWRTVKRLRPPAHLSLPDLGADYKAETGATEPLPMARKPWYRDTSRLTLRRISMLAGSLIFCTAGHESPLARRAVDAPWVLAGLYMTQTPLIGAIDTLAHIPRKWKYTPPSSISEKRTNRWSLTPIIEKQSPTRIKILGLEVEARPQQLAALAVSILLLVGCSTGHPEFMVVATAAVIMTMLPNWVASTLSIRGVVLAEIGLTAYFSLAVILPHIFPSTPKAPAPPSLSRLFGLPATWLMPFLGLWLTSIWYIVPGVLMLLNLRYEDSRRASAPDQAAGLEAKGGPGEPLEAASALPGFLPSMAPLHYFGLTLLLQPDALRLACALRHSFTAWKKVEVPFEYIGHSWFAVQAGLVLGSVVITLLRGDFRQWWSYFEVWHPTIDPELLSAHASIINSSASNGNQAAEVDKVPAITP